MHLKLTTSPVHETDEPTTNIISRLQAMRRGPRGSPPPPTLPASDPHASAPPSSRLWHTLVANRTNAGLGAAPTLPSAITAARLDVPLSRPPPTIPRQVLVGSNNPSLIAAVIQGPASVGPVLVQAGLPLVPTVPTWGNLFHCIEHKEGQVRDAIRAVGSMNEMTVAVADVPLPLLAVIGGGPSPGVNFRVLGLHPVALNQRLRPVPPSPHTRNLLALHQQAMDTPVFIVYIYGAASLPIPMRLTKLTNSRTEPCLHWRRSTSDCTCTRGRSSCCVSSAPRSRSIYRCLRQYCLGFIRRPGQCHPGYVGQPVQY